MTSSDRVSAPFVELLDTRPETLREAAEDFGHLVCAPPLGVLRPRSAAEVEDALAYAGPRGIPVAARAGGHSMYGQGQAPGGIVLDLRELSAVGPVTGDRVEVEAGALWRDVLTATLPYGLAPPVLTDYLGAGVGGVLSVGGLGGAGHRHGLVADSVLELEVVTGAGEHLVCSPERHGALFHTVLAGLGQVAVIVRATLRLSPAPALVRRYCLYYPDLDAYLSDQRLLATDGRFGYLEGQARPVEDTADGWRYMVEAVAAHQGPTPPDDTALLGDLSFGTAEIEDLGYAEFADRVAVDEETLRASGEWLHPHPWLNLLLPEDTAASVVTGILADPAFTDLRENGLVLLYPLLTRTLRAPLFRRPRGEVVHLLALLRTAVPGAADPMVAANRRAYEYARAEGAVAYPANALPMSAADWREHYGSLWGTLAGAKAVHDPHGVLGRGHGMWQ
ncbi:FAD/FMN-containing dehydrogenase [Streptomyces sp. Ag109_O5-1]|uniref:FAD-binding protein n=1 Tax=Streptomyces sp. Ag109_O5-1 TaxID=1938851 RepID=UPI000FBE5F49|nr:FAD-binding protein [Streptomyces sp. Ag109_O5-1]RPE46506.1 FAD/FMN-containing dehydrogenase [Streptomyces sp. Ag109_O5-1]